MTMRSLLYSLESSLVVSRTTRTIPKKEFYTLTQKKKIAKSCLKTFGEAFLTAGACRGFGAPIDHLNFSCRPCTQLIIAVASDSEVKAGISWLVSSSWSEILTSCFRQKMRDNQLRRSCLDAKFIVEVYSGGNPKSPL
ncbi:hypothetical protein FCV25MIE_02976 [Fagus crenata]